MEYDKLRWQKLNERKVLHKVRKHWIVMSVALLGMVGGGALTHVNARAAVTPNQLNHQVAQGTLNVTGQTPQSSIHHQANVLHNQILARAVVNSSGPRSQSDQSTAIARPQRSAVHPVLTSAARIPQVRVENWGQTHVKFISDGDHGNAGGDVAEVEPGAISDAFHQENDSDISYGHGQTGSYVVNRYKDELTLPFDQTSNRWVLKFDPDVVLPEHGGISKGDQIPRPGEEPDDVDYYSGVIQTNDYSYLLSSTNRALWNHFRVMDLRNLNTEYADSLAGLFRGDQALQKVILNRSANPHVADLQSMFAGDSQLKEVDFNSFNTSHVKNMDSMFMSDLRLKRLDLGALNTSHVQNMHAMFMSDAALTNLQGVDQLDTSQVANMISMFSGDQSLSHLDLSRWDTRQVTSMAGMFAGDTHLQSLDLSGFQTERVTDMSSMFAQDRQLQTLNLANFTTSRVQIPQALTFGGMSFMFSGDNNLQELTLGAQTNLDRSNQDWGANFFNQNFDVQGNDSTSAIKKGRQTTGTYYSADYYDHIFMIQQYFNDEIINLSQVLNDANVKADPQARSRIQQEASQTNQVIKSAEATLNIASVSPKMLSDLDVVSDLADAADHQATSASNWVASRASASASARASAVRSAASSTAASISRSASASTSASLSASTALSQRASLSRSASVSTVASFRNSVATSASLSRSAALSASVSGSLSVSASEAFSESVSRSLNASASVSTSDSLSQKATLSELATSASVSAARVSSLNSQRTAATGLSLSVSASRSAKTSREASLIRALQTPASVASYQPAASVSSTSPKVSSSVALQSASASSTTGRHGFVASSVAAHSASATSDQRSRPNQRPASVVSSVGSSEVSSTGTRGQQRLSTDSSSVNDTGEAFGSSVGGRDSGSSDSNQGQLPQTGESSGLKAEVLALMNLTAVIWALGLAIDRRRRSD